MTRKIRPNEANSIYSVMVNGLNELNIFKNVCDKARYIYLVEKYAIIYHINVYCYNFTDNSVDIKLHDSKGNLSKYMKCINGTYSQHYFNVKYDRNGTIYKDRFKSRLIGSYIYNSFVNSIFRKRSYLNDGNIVNFDLDSNTVFEMTKEHFKLDVSKFFFDANLTYTEEELNAISVLIFSLRSFCGFIHKKISKILKGVSETMSSTLSLNGVDLIKDEKYRRFYFKLLMVIYSDERNCVDL